MSTSAREHSSGLRRDRAEAASGEGGSIALTVNGRAHTVDVDPATPLLYVLSDDLALNGPKFGCGLGQCGACAVIIGGGARGRGREGWREEGVSASRRDFLKSGGALIVSFSSLAACADELAFAQGPFATQDQRVARQLDSWLAIGADGRVTAYTGKCELGQGIFTVQMQLVAEELSVPLARVTLIQCDTATTPDQGTTSGSQSTPTNFNEANLAQACATAREALLRLAAARLAVPVEQLTVVDGVVGVQGDASRRVGYGELVGGQKLNPTLKPQG